MKSERREDKMKKNILKFWNPISGKKNQALFFLTALTALILLGAGCGEKKKKIIPKSPVSLRSIPDKVNVNVISHKKKIGTTPWKGDLFPGIYVFEFTKPGYKTTWRKITCKPGSREDLEVKIEPITASVIIETEPAGATLKFRDRQIGETPYVLHNVPLGTHTYTLEKPGFTTREITVVVEDERPQIVSQNMSSNIGTLIVRSTPSNANLFINGSPRGKTPATVSLERGDHDIKLELSGHSPHKEKVSVGRGKTSRINITLQELPGSIKIVTNPKNATLHINGKQYNNTPTILTNLKPGTYDIKVSHDKFDTSSRKVSLVAGQNLTVNMTLDTNMGGIDLIVHPPGVTVYVDGKKLGVTAQGETADLSKVFEIRNLKSGIHTVELAHKRAKPSTKKCKIEVKKGKIRRLMIKKRFWVKNTYLKLKDGCEFTGRIAQEDDDEILFEPDPTMKIRYPRDDIEIIRPLKESE